MKRVVWGILLTVIVAIGATHHVSAGVDDFTVSKFDADYYLAADAEGRSTLKIVERITAEFPSFDQNHGIERAIPTHYDSHPTSLKVESITDESGRELKYSTYESNGHEVLRIGEADKYVQGSHTYIVTYKQRDVTRYFGNTDRQEFYWNVNGTQWRQSFSNVTVRIHLAPSLLPAFTKDTGCYHGVAGSTATCETRLEGDTITATVADLPRGGNMTIALGFKPSTFAAYELSFLEKAWGFVVMLWTASIVITSFAGFVLIVVVSYRYSALSNRRKEMGTIVPEYLPPKEASVLIAAQIAEGARAEMVAQIMDLAVRHYLKIYQTKEKGLFKSAEYELEIVKPIDDLHDEEKKFLTTLFAGVGTKVGARFEMKTLRSNYTVAAKFRANTTALGKAIKGKYKLRQKDESASQWFKRAGVWALVISIVTLSPLLLVAAIVALVCASQLYPLTDKGLALRRYLAGLKLYIGVAEQERLKMLQSPEGADKVGVVGDDAKQLVKLYEKVLPYAVLFGQEKEWNKQLGAYYEANGSSPDWYTGQTAFSAAVFTSSLNDFSSTTNSYSAASSSSSGGSDGGGSSGGGGGGGGGGGW